MIRKTLAWLGLLVALVSNGCGSKPQGLLTAPLTDEQKQAIRDEDQRVAEEESPGNPTTQGKTNPRK